MDEVVKCKEGWKSLYQPIIDAVLKYDSIHKNMEDKIGIVKIEPSYGSLNVVLGNSSNASELLKRHIYNAKTKSKTMCEICGGQTHLGWIKYNGYITCHCKECYESIKDKENIVKWVERKVQIKK